MKITLISFASLLTIAFSPCLAQSRIQLGEMECLTRVEGDSLWIQLTAPTTGWIAVGFNSRNDILGSDLLQFRIREGIAEAQDQFVVGVGQHPEDRQGGGTHDIRLVSAEESKQQSRISFRIPLNSNDPFDFNHHSAQDYWLILAWSVSDDFDHHSRFRQHTRYRLPQVAE